MSVPWSWLMPASMTLAVFGAGPVAGNGGPAGGTQPLQLEKGPRMEIKRSGSQPSAQGPAENFTGRVRIDPLFQVPPPARGFGASVTFEPGSRTAWHVHPLGQTLIVTAFR
jgi:hypothetical protein